MISVKVCESACVRVCACTCACAEVCGFVYETVSVCVYARVRLCVCTVCDPFVRCARLRNSSVGAVFVWGLSVLCVCSVRAVCFVFASLCSVLLGVVCVLVLLSVCLLFYIYYSAQCVRCVCLKVLCASVCLSAECAPCGVHICATSSTYL